MAPTVDVGSGPTAVAVDQSNHTAYVANVNDNTVSIVDTARCNAQNSTGCGQVAPMVAVGIAPVADVLDSQNRTVYVINTGDSTISMIDAASCNAVIVSACSHVSTVSIGYGPDFAGVDTSTHTVYVVNVGNNSVSVFNAATCNATVTAGCGHVATVAVGNSPTGLAVDEANHTVYVATGLFLSTPGSVSMIDTATCNTSNTTGCTRTPRNAPAGVGASWVAVDASTHTVYVAGADGGGRDTSLGFVDVINDGTCNATTTSGCAKAPVAVTVGSGPIGVAVDPRTDSVFVPNQEDSTVSVIDEARCNASVTLGCNQQRLTVAVGFDPTAVTVDPSTGTLYVPNFNESTVSVLDATACTFNPPVRVPTRGTDNDRR